MNGHRNKVPGPFCLPPWHFESPAQGEQVRFSLQGALWTVQSGMDLPEHMPIKDVLQLVPPQWSHWPLSPGYLVHFYSNLVNNSHAHTKKIPCTTALQRCCSTCSTCMYLHVQYSTCMYLHVLYCTCKYLCMIMMKTFHHSQKDCTCFFPILKILLKYYLSVNNSRLWPL